VLRRESNNPSVRPPVTSALTAGLEAQIVGAGVRSPHRRTTCHADDGRLFRRAIWQSIPNANPGPYMLPPQSELLAVYHIDAISRLELCPRCAVSLASRRRQLATEMGCI
jgi:hypothetical protein